MTYEAPLAIARTPICLPEALADYREVPGDRYYGYEFYGFIDPLATWIDTKLGNRNTDIAGQEKPFVIEIGGGSGFKAMSLAKNGKDVLIIDRDDTTASFVLARNELLKRTSSQAGRIDLIVSDVRTLTAADIQRASGNRTPSAIVSFLCVHFMRDDELANFFQTFARIASCETFLGLSYQSPSRRANGNNDLYFRYAKTVENIALRSELELVTELPRVPKQEEVVRQVFRLKI